MPIRKLNIDNIVFDMVRNKNTLFGWKVCFSGGNELDASLVESALAVRVEQLQSEIRMLKFRITIMKRMSKK